MALPIPDTVTLAGVTCFCMAMAAASYYRKVFDLSGSLLAFVVGMIIGICGSVIWLLLLLVFLVTSFGITRYRLDWKRKEGLQEGKSGERTWRNIAANGAVPSIIAFASFLSEAAASGGPDAAIFSKDTASFLFVTSVAVAAADTAASEIGIIDPRVYLITTFKRIKRGTDGGVSLTGQIVAFVAAAYTSAIAYVAFSAFDTDLLAGPRTLLIPMLCGFLGCQIDSVIGALWERRGRIGKLGNNFISISFGAFLALLFALGS